MQSTVAVGKYCYIYKIVEDGEALFVVKEYDHNVSEVFEDTPQALKHFQHTERYEARQDAKGMR